MASEIDWTQIQPSKKWHILRKQWRFALWALYTSIGCMMLGFDFGIAGTATALPAFQKKMGVPYPLQLSGYLIPASVQSAWSAVSICGEMIGVILAGQIMEYLGRKHTIVIGNILTSVRISVQIASRDWKVFLAGRLINAVGFGTVFIIPPVWIGENVRPELRGTLLCVQTGSIIWGQFVLALVAYGTQFIAGKWSYQTLVVLQFAFVAVLVVGYPFFPESPYFLLNNRRDDASARDSLQKIYGLGDMRLIDAELMRLKEMIVVNKELAAAAVSFGHPLLQIFKNTNRKRTLIAVLGPAAQQLIGAAFVLGYITYFLDLLGIANYFEVSVALYCVMLASNIAAFPLVESAGRRGLLLIGITALTLIELVMGIAGAIANAAALWVILVCIFLWAIFYQASIGAVGFALAAEVPTAPLRPATITVVTVAQGFFAWLIGFVSPYMINPDAGNLGGKVGFVFMGLGLPLCILFYFFIPETLGLGFEEQIDQLFAAKVSPRHFERESAIRKHAVSEQTNRKNDVEKATPASIGKEIV